MGANVSTSVKNLTNEVESTLSQHCDASSNVSQEIKGVIISNGLCPNIVIENRAKVLTNCDIGALATTLAENAEKLTEEQKAGLGLNLSTDVSVNSNKIKNMLESACNTQSNIDQKINNLKIKDVNCDLLKIANTADTKTQCLLSAIDDSVSKLKADTKISQKGFDPTTIIIVVAAIIAALILLALVFMFSGGSTPQYQYTQYPYPQY